MCPEGSKTIEVNSLGFKFPDGNQGQFKMQCEVCPVGQYTGRSNAAIWDCITCPDPVMVYVGGICTCPRDQGFREAGEGCISQDEYDALVAGQHAVASADELQV